jgi:hypothetical protein
VAWSIFSPAEKLEIDIRQAIPGVVGVFDLLLQKRGVNVTPPKFKTTPCSRWFAEVCEKDARRLIVSPVAMSVAVAGLNTPPESAVCVRVLGLKAGLFEGVFHQGVGRANACRLADNTEYNPKRDILGIKHVAQDHGREQFQFAIIEQDAADPQSFKEMPIKCGI